MPTNNQLCEMSAVDLAALIRNRTVSALEATEAVLDRMERAEPDVHAFCTPTPELARREAKRIDAGIASGASLARLPGFR